MEAELSARQVAVIIKEQETAQIWTTTPISKILTIHNMEVELLEVPLATKGKALTT